jgi:asparagine synthase (glutamine-hydrolysing)
MNDILAHRGPDGEGFHLDGPVGLGHRRLAIIDLDTGAQPMTTADGGPWIVFNGEIYNFRELRLELEAVGHRFRTSSDTEVILAAYERWGVECPRRLRGMFTFAIWDPRRRRLFLARDRVGIKPLVYSWDGRRLLFASEIKSILQSPDVPRTLDWDALREYLTYHYIPAPRTIFKEIRKLLPASSLVIDVDGGQPQLATYWNLKFAPDERRSEGDWVAELQVRLDDAVKSHLVSDVPVGAFLSGGMDSSTVVAMMARAAGGRIRTFSIGFDESDFDELAYARQVARRYGTDHYELVVKPDAVQALQHLSWQLDEPFADSSVLPTYYVSKITREQVTVALSGDGGDENFAGYRRYARASALHDRLDRGPGVLARGLSRLAGRMLPAGVRGRGTAELFGAGPIDRYARMMTYERPWSLRRLLTADAQRQMSPFTDAEAFHRVVAAGGAPDYVAALQHLDIHTYLPNDILAKVDWASMLVSLESRVPLLDHELMEFVATMPTRFKLVNGTGKAILKTAMRDMLPAEVIDRPKMGFGVPLARWFRGELADFVTSVLSDRRTQERGWLDRAAMTRLVAEHASGARDRSSAIWAVVSLELWARRWFDTRGT